MRQCFVSYAHDDRGIFGELLEHLVPLEDALSMSFWHDDRIHGGHQWHDSIGREIRQSSSFILLFSPKYVASSYIRTQELPQIVERQKADQQVLTLPVIAQKCLWQPYIQQLIQPLPIDRKRRPLAIVDWRPKRDGYYEAALQLGRALGSWYGLHLEYLVPDSAAGSRP